MMQKNTFGEILFFLFNSEKMMVQKTRWSKKLYEQMLFDTVLIRNVTESFMGMQVKLNLPEDCRNLQKFSSGRPLEEWIAVLNSPGQCEILSEQESQICHLILESTNQIFLTLLNQGKGYKQEIVRIFRAIHNLPRVFIDSELRMTKEDALASYYFWMEP